MFNRKVILWSMGPLLMLCACDRAQTERSEAAQTVQDVRIVSLQNSSRQVVTRVVILDALASGSQHRVLYRQDTYLASGVDQVFFLPDVKQCEFIVHVEFLGGQTVDKPAQDFCQRNTLVLDKNDGRGEERKRVAFIANA